MKSNRWAKKITEWWPMQGSRTKGTPKRRWKDEIKEKTGREWMQRVQERRVWKRLWRPSAISGSSGKDE